VDGQVFRAWCRTPEYYKVCEDLIAETIDLFDKPRFFHLGMDEEEAIHQANFEYVVMRQHGLWWRDVKFLFKQCEDRGSRPWIWGDYVWNHSEEFLQGDAQERRPVPTGTATP
jgi:hypothetical protein